MGTIKELRWWAYKILPLAYDDSLSYYEVLSKATQKLNEVIDTTNKMPEAISQEVTEQLSGDDTDIYNKLFGGIINAIATKEADEITFTPSDKQGGEIVWLGNTLYEVIAPMVAGTNYIVGTNITPVDIDGELEKIKGYICTHNEFFHEKAEQNHDAQTYLYWKDKLYRVDADIKVNDIISEKSTINDETIGQLTLVNTMDEITAHYIEMHKTDNNLQTQIDSNDSDINDLQNEDKKLQKQITDNNTTINNRVDNIVAQAGNDNTEIVDARKVDSQKFGELSLASLKASLNYQFERCVTGNFQFYDDKVTEPWTDANTFMPNNIVWFNTSKDIKNLPAEILGKDVHISYFGFNSTLASNPTQIEGTVQFIYCFSNNKLYTRMIWIDGATEWKTLANWGKYEEVPNDIFKGIINSSKRINDNSEAPYNDFNTLPNNIMCLAINEDISVLHIPNSPENNSYAYSIITYNSYKEWYDNTYIDQINGQVQLVFSLPSKNLYIRTYDTNRGWTEWQNLSKPTTLSNSLKEQLISSYMRINGDSPAPYNDFNTLPNNIMCLGVKLDLSDVNLGHSPETTKLCSIITYNSAKEWDENSTYNLSNGCVQIVYCESGNCYIRFHTRSEWTEWVNIVNNQKTIDKINISSSYQNHVRKPLTFNGKKILFCGDSITRGFTSTTTITENGFPKVFSDSVGATFINAGVGGASLAPHENYGYIYDQLNRIDDSTDIVFIAGGVNDWQLATPLNDIGTNIKKYCDYLHENFSNKPVIWITPINNGGWNPQVTPVGSVEKYRELITQAILENDTQHCFSILQGKTFGFPTSEDDTSFITYAYGDKLHPTENAYANIYVPAMLNALL